ncbi:MAG: hypothetical protein L3J88_10725 [Gammaproteobacteria bacterium]|nr:hypothetical protein [Gammaproteobacteria bacterium]MCF6363792.1 hypothetical protein [Gammaproteobacteria bacterium]
MDKSNLNLVKLFQVLIVISTLNYVILFFLPYFPEVFSPETQKILAYNGYGAVISSHLFIYGTVFLLWILSAIGIFFFQNYGRILFLFMYILSIFMIPFFGVSVSAPIESLMFAISDILDIAIITLAYFSPLSGYFKTRSK